MDKESLIKDLISEGCLKTRAIIDAFKKIDRVDFIPQHLRASAYINAPLSIGFGQTISQPLTVAFMLELLEVEAGNKILEIGSGSGWQTALLAHIVSAGKKPGKIFAVERIPELCEFGKNNVAKYNYSEKGIVKMFCADGTLGLAEEAPFDRIIAAASAQEIPPAWQEQLKIEGRLVTPVGNSVWLLIKKSKTEFEKTEYHGFSFVPLVTERKIP